MTDLSDDELRAAATQRELPVHDYSLLRQALTHKSLVPDRPFESNERLEFLGDGVLGLIIDDYLFRTYPERTEGELAKAKALVVCKSALAEAASRLSLQSLLQIGMSEEVLGGRNRASLLADAYEAIIAVIYLESGFERASAFVQTTLADEIAQLAEARDWRDSKSILQEQRQATHRSAPVYRVVAEQGKPHDKTFAIEVLLDGAVAGSGVGKTKKEAEQAAAEAALQIPR
jgi:ribonuclease-3